MVKSSLTLQNLISEHYDELLENPQEYLETVSNEEAAAINAALVPAYQESFRIIFCTGAGLAAGAFVVAFFLMPHIELSRPDDQKLKEEGCQQKTASSA